ncbi:unnamed protein product [Porites evermanni]|uniref:SRCR domain-containing protein n=1 Tax=Porites evermanni TaxID=104178 RepID=A0ABN8MM49_9CNID|nr:unnamed protein product [Porites evermanni]
MRLLWSLRGLLAIASLAAFSKATVEIPYRIRLITANDDIGGGRIEVYHNGQWGTICDKSWSEQAAKVACRELGFKTALYPAKRAFFGEGSGPVMTKHDPAAYKLITSLFIQNIFLSGSNPLTNSS